MGEQDFKLYEELLSLCGDITQFVEKTKTYPTQLTFGTLNRQSYKHIFEGMTGVVPRQELFKFIPDLENECKSCWRFYLAPRNKSIRGLDVRLGQKFQEKIREFLHLKGIDCKEGDIKDKRYPDNVVYKDGKVHAYLEIKYQSAPWLFAFKEEGSNKECYESSPALDIKKLNQQHELVQSGEITVPVYYVYWLDLPCIKGIFFIDIHDMYEYFKSDAIIFDRKEREGDFITKNGEKIKVSATSKIHPSVFQMKSFSELLGVLS